MKTLRFLSYIYAGLGAIFVLHNLLVYLAIIDYGPDSAFMAAVSEYYWPAFCVYAIGICLMFIFWRLKKQADPKEILKKTS